MCAGAAVYSALRSAGVQWHHRVGVLGLGGLGHLAVQYAAKMGCHVTAYSHSSGKEEAARNLGALDFQVLGDTSTSSRAVDCLLLTGSQQPDWSQSSVAGSTGWRDKCRYCGFIGAAMLIWGGSDERDADPGKPACRPQRPT